MKIDARPIGDKWLFFLPLGPSTNKRTMPVRFGKRSVRQILTTEARNYLSKIGFSLKKWREGEPRFKPVSTYHGIELWVIMPRRSCDPTNYEKVLFDALQKGGIVTNDRYLMPNYRGIAFDAKDPQVIFCL